MFHPQKFLMNLLVIDSEFRISIAVAYRAPVPPEATTSNAALSGNNFWVRPKKNVNQLAKISDDFFLVVHHKNENFTLRIVPLAPPFGLCRP